MGEGVQGKPPVAFGGVVAEQFRARRVPELVEGEGEHDGGEQEREEPDLPLDEQADHAGGAPERPLRAYRGGAGIEDPVRTRATGISA